MSQVPPGSTRLMSAIDATWPAAEFRDHLGWRLRRGAGGGKRVSAASGSGGIADAVTGMAAWGQPPLFSLTQQADDLDTRLSAAGYEIVDPVVMYTAEATTLTGEDSLMAKLYTAEMRPAVMEEIWRAGGIGPDRLAIMDRCVVPNAFLLSRAADSPCGAAFVGVDDDVAMIHAIEVLPRWRRHGAGALLIRGAARFAVARGARWLSLAVVERNTPARALYDKIGMSVTGRYHYRYLPEGTA